MNRPNNDHKGGRDTRILIAAAFFIWLAALILYRITLAPDVLAHDSGEWQVAAATLGISHAPGAPAYMLIGHLFSLLPFGTVAARVSFASAVAGAIGVAATFVFMRLLLDRWLPASISALSLAVAGLWWSFSSVASPYNMVTTVIALAFVLLLLWNRKGDVRLIWAGAFLIGFGFCYHVTILQFVPFAVAGVFVLGPWRKLLAIKAMALTLLFLALGLSFYAYVPIRSAADPVYAYDTVDSVGSFINYVTARQARSTGEGRLEIQGIAGIRSKLSTVVRDSYFPSYSIMVFATVVILFYKPLWPILRPRRRLLVFYAAAIFGNIILIFLFFSTYEQYYVPLLLYFSLWAGLSIYLLMIMVEEFVPGSYRLALKAGIVAVYLVFIALGVVRNWDFVNHRNDTSMRKYADNVYSVAAPGATVLSDWTSYPGLLYAQLIDHQRDDIKLVSVPSNGWRSLLPEIDASQTPQLLLSLELPGDKPNSGVEVTPVYYLGVKGKTYQSYEHNPLPVAMQLFLVKDSARE